MALAEKILFANNAISTLAGGITDIAVSLSVQAGHGSRFPNPAAGECFIITFRDAAGNTERAKSTARTGDTISSLTRGIDGTVARAWVAGDKVEVRLGKLELDHVTTQLGANVFAVGAGTADAITATFVPAFSALVNGMEVRVRASGANTVVAPTFAPDGLVAKAIVKRNNAALVAGDIGASHELILRYSAALDRWVLLNPLRNIDDGEVVTAKLADTAVTTPKLADDAVTYAKLQNVSATDRLLGRATAAAGDVEEIVCTPAGRALLDDADAATQRATLGLGALATLGSVGQAQINSAAVGQAQLKTTTGNVSAALSGPGNVYTAVLPGGEYGFIPTTFSSASPPADLTATVKMSPVTTSAQGFFVYFETALSGSWTVTARQRYVQSSPPYESYRSGEVIPRFLFALLEKSSGKIVAGYDADDPPWANNGPTVINPLGRVQDFLRRRLTVTAAEIKDNPSTRAKYEQELAEQWDFLCSPAGAAQAAKELARPTSQAKKNADMALIPHPFGKVDPSIHQVVAINPVDDRFSRGLSMRALVGDSVLEALHNGYFVIDNSPMPGLATPPGVMAVATRWKLS